MPGKPIKIGPFTGGLNNISLAGEADDDELVQLVNMEVANDSSIVSRPPMGILPGSTLPNGSAVGWEVLGIYRVTVTEWYLITVSPKPGSTSLFLVQAHLNADMSNNTLIKEVIAGNRPTAMTQFKDVLYFLTGINATINPFKWTAGGVTSDVAQMKRGTVLISWKGRLWSTGSESSINGDRLYFSTVNAGGPQPDTWEATNFFDVAPGEGGFITNILPSFNNLIVFKTDGTWRFSYPSSPSAGQVDKVNGSIGAASKNSVLEYDNYIYVYDQGVLYELINSSYTQINRFVEFREDGNSVDLVAPGVELSVMDRRLIVRYFNSIYAFNIETKTWSSWFSYYGTPGRFYELPQPSESSVSSTYVAASMGTVQAPSVNVLVDPNSRDPKVKAARMAVEGGTLAINEGTYTLTTSANSEYTEVHMNRVNDPETFDIPVAPGQVFTISFESTVRAANCGVKVTYLKSDSTTFVATFIPTADLYTADVTIPDGTILAKMSLFNSSALGEETVTTYKDLNYQRKSKVATFSLLTAKDLYPQITGYTEYIDCWIETKSYDYQAPASSKRMFWWGIDVLTPREITASARPVSRVTPITWGQLDAYTWDELEQGSWELPLSWLGSTNDVVDYADASGNLSANGRYFIKLMKNMRFRQISYKIKMSSLGDSDTGPIKIFSLTAVVLPKQDVVDKVS